MTQTQTKQRRGKTSYLAGLAAETAVSQDYQRRGRGIAHTRWRGQAGEIDLIARDKDEVIFIEVKKSRSFAQAAYRLGRRQMDRLCAAASEFVASEPLGQLTPMRFDVALVNAAGEVHIIENAFGEA